ncbi:phage antirepressor KilAC domain-containing protein [Paenibacillus sp. FSL W8-1287]|uniref:phage antirepressor KilAC domain-containing protein n=1 Tax=Paenibacillus sp. FSL W8-1287 TaxID=2954653 RepID=UPI0030D20716
MSQQQIFKNEMFGELPVLVVSGVEWFGATEAAKALSFSNPYTAIPNHVDEDDLSDQEVMDSLGRKQTKKFINESGLYSLIFGAAKQGNNPGIQAKAKSYKRWVTSEVLPAIRKHGGYLTPEKVEEALLNPDVMIQLATTLKEERARREKLQQQIEEDKPKVIFAEALEVSKDSILIADLAKLLRQNGVDIGEVRLFKLLRQHGYLIKSGSEYNMPTQRSMDLKIMEIKVGYRGSASEGTKVTRTPKITGKGINYFINKFKGESRLA